MNLLNLKLGINLEGAILFESRKEDSAFLRLQRKVFVRDDYTCRFCGFRAEEYQEIVNINGNYRNNDIDNLATACVFCAHSQLIGLKNSSKVIYLSDINQADLNQLMRILFCSSYFGESYSETAKTLVQALKQRANPIENVFGKESSESILFAQTYIDALPLGEENKAVSNILTQLRWLPIRTDYEHIIHYWADQIITKEMLEQRIANYVAA